MADSVSDHPTGPPRTRLARNQILLGNRLGSFVDRHIDLTVRVILIVLIASAIFDHLKGFVVHG